LGLTVSHIYVAPKSACKLGPADWKSTQKQLNKLIIYNSQPNLKKLRVIFLMKRSFKLTTAQSVSR